MALPCLTWWLSPGVVCFLLLNALVAAIAVTSGSRAQQGARAASTTTTGRRLCRSASSMVLDRVRSFSSAMFAAHPSVELCHYYVCPEVEEQNQVSGAGAARAPDRQLAVLEPASSVAAISMVSGNVEDETAAGAVKSMVSSDGDGTCALGQAGRHAQEPMPSPPAAPAAVAVVTADTARVAALVRGPPEEEPATVAESVKRKHRRGDRVYAVEGKAELNARAEQFIRQFQQELRLQRLDSMLSRRHAHTLSTGSGAPPSRELQSGCSI